MCGWTGHWSDERATADYQAVDHWEVAVDPPTGLDAAISGLLDLQDDIADVVMWLAESWSADLPVPTASAWTDYSRDAHCEAGLSLLACGDSDDELGRMADLLGVPTVPDRALDSLGNRYERAVRRFGRVRLTAYWQISRETVE